MINTHEKLLDEMSIIGVEAYCVLQQIARFTSIGKKTKYLRNFKLSALTGLSQRKITQATKTLEKLGYIEKKQVFVTEENLLYFSGKKIGSFGGLTYKITTKYLSKFVNLEFQETDIEIEKVQFNQEVDDSTFDDIVNDDSVTDDSVKTYIKSIDNNKVLKVKSIENIKVKEKNKKEISKLIQKFKSKEDQELFEKQERINEVIEMINSIALVYSLSKEVLDAFLAYGEMRATKGVTTTKTALILVLKQVTDLSQNSETNIVNIFTQSTIGGYTRVFKLNDNNHSTKNTQSTQTTQSKTEIKSTDFQNLINQF